MTTGGQVHARVPVRAEHDYDVVIGTDLLAELPALVADATRVFLMHPPSLAESAMQVATRLTDAGYQVLAEELPDGEQAKTAQTAARCWAALGQAAFTRTDVVIGLGGGATTDLAGFVAATWLRGVRVIQVPTTLLAMVDAAVGGKTGINTGEGKNLVGSFHSPTAVVCDLAWLRTLGDADLRAGMAEVIKCGFIADPRILELVEADALAALVPDGPVLAELVERAVRVKAEVVSADLKESSLREVLNYGHTFAHAVELNEEFRWRHGEAVSVGMVFVAELAHRAGLIDAALTRRHRDVLSMVGLPTTYRPGAWEALRTAMGRDKKTRGATLRFVVLEGLARPTRLTGPDPALLEATYTAISEGSGDD
ncbi:3-dehydroquinate synthase [Ruania halotolerans]|uniref:3-dehydroquinate synthase n=1 Tax=Ruania halotolerans TaxID=2897773 RepID=UPI001E36B770|nr:3-dehydroquinate synthase [Ruania halotolerans]UFU04739.1 3-dehydroquinate synthase [Ruania halotolerans]